jgi:PhzF family phenazine biosynthesis protein
LPFRIFQVDAFADKPFAGNPAGVCLLEKPMGDAWMQNVAAEMNLSETAFPLKQEDGWSLRWFTPKVEVDLCGHATLATAHVFTEIGLLEPGEEARFITRSGLLTAKSSRGCIELDFPAQPEQPASPPPGLLEALAERLTESRNPLDGIVHIGRNRFDYLVEFASDDLVRGLDPNFERLKRVDARGVMVTARSSSPEFDFLSRFFAPAVGINEDPVTGSAHCCLGPYWMKKSGKSRFRAFQASSRGGMLEVEISGNRVFLRGKAVTVFKGEWLA